MSPTTTGAEISATEARAREDAASAGQARQDAEGAAIRHHRRQRRYTDFLRAAGVPVAHIEAAKAADQWRALTRGMLRAEQLGLDLEVALKSARSHDTHEQPL